MNETMKARDIPAAIHWHEGLLLTPQHFQQMTSRHEGLVQYNASVYSPFCWGLRRFKHQGLHTGKLQVMELEAVLPDGLVVSYNFGDGGESLEADLEKLKDVLRHRALPIYLAVMAQDGAANGNSDRYEQFNGGSNSDPASNGKSREIFRVRPKLMLKVGESLAAKYVGFPIGRVFYADSYRFDEEFIPPVLSLPSPSADSKANTSGATELADMCSAIAQKIRDRSSVLLNEKGPGANRFQSLPDGDAALLEQMIKRQQILSIVGALPVLEAMLQSGGLHPLNVYLGLCSVAGHLAVYGAEMIPDPFKPYNHDDLYATFRALIDFIERSLDEFLPVSYESFHFHLEDSSFQLHFDGAWSRKQLALAIQGPRGMSEEAVRRWGETCLIASEGKIEEIRKNRTIGVTRIYAERVGDVGPKKGVVLFSLPDTKQIEANKMLHILNDGAQPTDIVLHVLSDS